MGFLWKNTKAKKPPKTCEHLRNAERGVTIEAGTDNSTGKPVNTEQVQDPPAVPIDSKHPCPTCRQNQLAARRYRWKLFGGLFFPWVIQSLDVTIVAGALPFIASDFHELVQLNWIITAFNLTAATFIPVMGSYANIFGRHAALQGSLVIGLIGSALSAGAPLPNGFPMLLVGRALQGISCAGIGVLTHVVLADKVSLKENAKNNSIFALVGGLGYAIGPAVGGYLTQASWRWCFGINIPLALLGMISLFLIRKQLIGPQNIPGVDDDEVFKDKVTFVTRLRTIDFGGQILFLFGMGLLILALTWGGSYYSWSSSTVIIILVIGVVTIITFLVWEYLMLPGRKLSTKFPRQRAMIPLNLLWTRNIGLLVYVNYVTGMAMYSVFYFVDLYFVLVLAYPSSRAGIQLLYYTPGIGTGVYLAIFFCNKWPRKTWYPLALGTAIEAIGITLLAVALNLGHLPTICGMLGLTGAGSGLRFMPGSLHGVGYFPNHIASIMSLTGIAMSFGGISAMTVMFTVFNNKLANAGISFNPTGSTDSSIPALQNLDSASYDYFTAQVKTAIVFAFYAITPFMWLGVIATMGLGNVNITVGGKALEGEGERDFSNDTVKGSYLMSLLRRRETTPAVAETKEVVPAEA